MLAVVICMHLHHIGVSLICTTHGPSGDLLIPRLYNEIDIGEIRADPRVSAALWRDCSNLADFWKSRYTA